MRWEIRPREQSDRRPPSTCWPGRRSENPNSPDFLTCSPPPVPHPTTLADQSDRRPPSTCWPGRRSENPNSPDFLTCSPPPVPHRPAPLLPQTAAASAPQPCSWIASATTSNGVRPGQAHRLDPERSDERIVNRFFVAQADLVSVAGHIGAG